MNSRERFRQTMCYGSPDRVPYFEEGIRDEVLRAWYRQGLPRGSDLSQMFHCDRMEEIEPDLDPKPRPKNWPVSISQLDKLRKRLKPHDSGRLPTDWAEHLRAGRERDYVLMLRVHRGLFLSLGVYDWSRFTEVMLLLMEDPQFVHESMTIQGDFAAALADRLLQHVEIDAAIFSEPIGGNDRPLVSPKMYEEFALKHYQPLLDVLKQQGVETIIFRTYANARLLIPSILKWGFNCLWACEVNIEAMDYRDLRTEFGRDLRLIGGIDLDALRLGKDAIRREVEEKVPPLIADGGYVPLADGRVREDVAFEDYAYYRRLLEKVTQK